MNKLHYNSLRRFNEEIYTGFLSSADLNEEISIRHQKYWLAKKNKQIYLIDSDLQDKLPFVVDKSEELHYSRKVFHIVKEITPVAFKTEHTLNSKDLLDWFDIQCTSPTKHKLFRILMLSAVIGRVNFRIASEAGFGKDSFADTIGYLTNDISSTNPRTMAAIEYRLLNNTLVLNELSNLPKEQKELLQEFLLLVGAYKNLYEKSSRATSSTFDTYDTSKLSLVIFHNMYWDYILSNQEDKFFDRVFTAAVKDRFMPFAFTNFDPEYYDPETGKHHEGNPVRLDMSQFNDRVLTDEEYEQYKIEYIKVLREILYLRKNYQKHLKGFDRTFSEKFRLLGRHRDSFDRILDFVDLFSDNQQEFEQTATDLYNCHQDYYKSISESQRVINKIKEERTIEDLYDL